jgi:glutamate N-acetyltransferase / amino-acid N-acetyltransferase
MATMLGFVGTDAALAPGLLNSLVKPLADGSFNRITVDGDTSTNDSFIVMATGQAGHAPIDSWASADGQALQAALQAVATELAQAIVRDGEGATKFITVCINGAASSSEALKAAYAVAHSPLVKTALYASDPNLGRILAAVGYAGIADLDQTLISLHIGPVHVVQNGGRLASYVEADAAAVMAQPDIAITVGLGRGSVSETVWTCDFSEDYVKINADYRS